jgi:hypothetical protein
MRASRRRWPLYALVLLVAAGAIVAGVLTLGGSNGRTPGANGAPAKPVPVTGVGAYDPDGGDGEHDSDAPKATDGDTLTYWTTEHYRSFSKSGVGVVVDARRSLALRTVTVTSDTGGFQASILAGNAPAGPFVTDSGSKTVNGTATFDLRGRKGRYYVVWITNLGGNSAVHVNEVRARG